MLATGCTETRLTQGELARFRQAVLPIYDGYSPEQKEIIRRIQES